MFMFTPQPNEKGQALLAKVKRFVGHIPPHFELFAALNPTRFEMFLNEIFYLSTHKTINPDFFAFVRLAISVKENFHYCHHFNRALLEKKGYSQETLDSYEKDVNTLPLDDKHLHLLQHTLIAIDTPEQFGPENIEELNTLGWSQGDIFDAIDHGAFLYRFSKILKAYAS